MSLPPVATLVALVLATAMLQVSSQLVECPSGWTLDGINCYKPFNILASWDRAHETCESYGSRLVEVGDGAVVDRTLNELSSETQFWTGLNRRGLPAGWVRWGTEDSSFALQMAPANWGPDQPTTDATYMCVFVDGETGLWSFGHCEHRRNFICQLPACSTGSFYCANGRCVATASKCDGVNDCGDLSDETDAQCSACSSYSRGTNGSIESENYPLIYPTSSTCYHVIETPPNTIVKLMPAVIFTEQHVDIVQVYVGARTEGEGELVRTYSGSMNNLPPVYSTNNFVAIKFTSDGVQGASGLGGYLFNYESVAAPASATEVRLEATGSWQTFSSPTVALTPSMSVEYPNFEGLWVITNPAIPTSEDRVLTLRIDSLDFADDSESEVEILDGSRLVSPELAKLKGEDGEPTYIVSTQSSVLIKYKSDGTKLGRGFTISYQTGCEGTFVGTSGNIASPGYTAGLSYSNLVTCTYSVSTPDQAPFHLFFTEFMLDTDDDELTVKDNAAASDTRIKSLPGAPIAIWSGAATVTFKTSPVGNAKGFAAQFSIDCPNITTTADTVVSLPAPYRYSSSVTFSCPDGFRFDCDYEDEEADSVVMNCLSGGRWDRPRFPKCIAKVCELPPEVDNGYLASSTGVIFNATATYACYDDYNLSPTATIRCQANATWEQAPTCTSQSCPAVPPPPFGMLEREASSGESNSTENRFGTVLRLKCQTGYYAEGVQSIVCQSDTNWNQLLGSCIPVSCPFVPVVNGYMLAEAGAPVQDAATREAYYLARQHWGAYYTNLSMFDNTTMFPRVTFSENATVRCRSGFEITGGDPSLTCNENGTFGMALPNCVDINECQSAPSAPGRSCQNTIGSFYYECASGYTLEGTNCQDVAECAMSPCDQMCTELAGSYTCGCDQEGYVLFTSDGQEGWSIPAGDNGTFPGDWPRLHHSCVLRQCAVPSMEELSNNTENAAILTTYQNAIFHVGDTFAVQCDLGYLTSPAINLPESKSVSTTCLSTGQWDKNLLDIVKCQRTSCLYNGMQVSAYDTPATSGPCDPGYSLEYNCLLSPATGQYTMYPQVTCPVTNCGPPPISRILNADLTSADGISAYIAGASFELRCNAGYRLGEGATPQVVCLASGRWDFNSIFCSGETCTDPGHVGGALRFKNQMQDQVDLGSFVEGGTVYYFCERTGYTISPAGSHTSTCHRSGSDFQWIPRPSTLSCVDTQSPVIANIGDCNSKVTARRYSQVTITAPTFTDNNYVRVVQEPSTFNAAGTLVSESLNVTFTAMDGADGTPGNTVSCQVEIEVVDEVLPTAVCRGPLVVRIVNSSTTVTLDSTNFSPLVTVTGDDNVLYSPTTVTKGFDDIGTPSAVLVTVTNSYGSSATCRIIVATEAEPCSEFFAPKPANVSATSCSVEANNRLSCLYTCQPGTFFEVFNVNGVPTASTSIRQICDPAVSWVSIPDCRAPALAQTVVFGSFSTSVTGITLGDAAINTCRDGLTAAWESYIRTRHDGPGVCRTNSIDLDNQLTVTLEQGVTNVQFGAGVGDALSLNFTLTFSLDMAVPITNTEACIENLNRQTDLFNLAAARTNVAGCPASVTSSILGNTKGDQTRCSQGAQQFTASVDGLTYTYCLACGQGLYWDETSSQCVPCAVGTYQPDSGAIGSCPQSCTSPKSTKSTGSTSASDCIDPCPAGQVSLDGLLPCYECAPGTYGESTTTCRTCPAGTLGKISGAASEAVGCQDPCPTGFYSVDGYMPDSSTSCSPCPANFYQNGTGSTSCLECATYQFTQASNTDSPAGCIDGQTTLCSPSSSSKCENHNGPCVFVDHQITCPNCELGFTGPTCSSRLDACASNPCQFGVDCVNGNDGNFACNCLTGTSGNSCENVTDGCASLLCDNGGVCLNRINDAVCLCPSGYRGTRCQDEDSPCDANPCDNGGRCNSTNQYHYWCECVGGYTGFNCDVDIDECASDPCLHDGNCTNLVDRFECTCPTGFSGSQCEVRDPLCSLDGVGPCPSSPSGRYRCHEDYVELSPLCLSDLYIQAVSADTAQATYDYCSLRNVTCQNDGMCTTEISTPGSAHFTCGCPDGYRGSRCQENIDNCLSNNCLEGSTCVDGVDTFTCACPPGAAGPTCADIIDCPNVNACNDRGTCTDFVGGYTCSCENGYEGPDCEVNVDDCLSSPCINGAECVDEVAGFRCICPEGLEGPTCAQSVDQCAANTCGPSGTCISLFAQYVCACQKPTFGANCQNEPDVCADSDPCLNGATCSVPTNETEPTCACTTGYDGDFCESCIDVCEDDPCGENGSCEKVFPSSYRCECEEGYSGARCEVELNGCYPNPCQASQTCIRTPLTAEFRCACTDPNKTGTNCTRDVDSNFDVYFDRSGLGTASIRAPFPFAAANGMVGQAATVALWIRIDNSYANDFTFLTLESSRLLIEPADTQDVLSFNTAGVRISTTVNGTTSTQQVAYPSDKQLEPGLWYFLAVSVNRTDALVWQTSTRSSATLSAAPLENVNFGVLTMGASEFTGTISQVNVWRTALIQDDLVAQVTENQVNAATTGRTFVSQGSNVIARWSEPNYEFSAATSTIRPSAYCTSSTRPANTCPTPPTAVPINTPVVPEFLTCPADFEVLTSGRSADVTWLEPTCGDCLITRSEIRPGMLAVGAHRIVYIGTFGTSTAVCSFTVYVKTGCPGIMSNGKCIEASSQVTYNLGEAVPLCNLLPGGKLFEPVDIDENNRVRNYVSGLANGADQYLIGVTDTRVEGTDAYYTSGAVLAISGVTVAGVSTVSADMNTEARDCVVLDKANGYLWRHVPCDESAYGYICERSVGNLENCATPTAPGSLAVSCYDAFPTRRCNLTCTDPSQRLPVSLPSNIVCDASGAWSYAVEGSVENDLPGCETATQALERVTLHQEFTTSLPCAGVVATKYEDVREHLADLDAVWNQLCVEAGCTDVAFCTDGNCDSLPRYIAVGCTEAGRKRKRRQATTTSTITLDIVLNDVPTPLLSTSNERLTPTELFLRDIIQDRGFLNTVMATTPLTTDDPLPNLVVNAVPSCQAGQSLVGILCVPCSAGSFDDGTNSCTLCPVGEYQSASGQTACMSCGPTSTTLGAGSSSAAACIDTCSAGSFYDTVAGGCVQCPRGTYQGETNQLVCDSCPIGFITNSTGATSISECIENCPSGQEYIGGSCQNCPMGQYKTAGVHLGCQDCDPDFTTLIQPAISSADCSVRICAAGEFNANSTMVCMPCPMNEYRTGNDPVQTSCRSCNVSEETASTGSTLASDCIFTCPDGEGRDGGSGPCVACPMNTYRTRGANLATDVLNCTTCPPYWNTTGSSSTVVGDCSVLSCPPGMQANATNMGCEVCPEGTYNDGFLTASGQCTSCGTNKWTMGDGKSSASDCLDHCPDGFELKAGVCEACNETSYRSNAVDGYFSMCLGCPGNGSDTTRQLNSTAVAQCQYEICKAGYRRDGFGCTACLKGFYQNLMDQLSCTMCPVDQTTTGTGAALESDCLLDCPIGKEDVNEQCVPCGFGSYKDVTGEGERCTACIGFNTTDTGSVSPANCTIILCPAGQRRVTGTPETCVDCGVGYYQSVGDFSGLACEACPMRGMENQTTSVVNATAESDCFVNCPAGTAFGTTKCDACGVGFYSTGGRNAVCTMCPDAAFTTPGMGSTSAADCTKPVCAVGQQYDAGSNSCTNCVIGSYKSVTGDGPCTGCGANFTTMSAGSTSQSNCIVDCPSGYQANAGNDGCDPCPLNEYRTAGSSFTCQACPNNGLTDSTATTSTAGCLPRCAAGQYLNRQTATCELCPFGTYQSATGTLAASCESCPDRNGVSLTTMAMGATQVENCSALLCPAGEQYLSSPFDVCERVPRGTYRSLTQQITSVSGLYAQPCPGSTTTRDTGATSIDACVIPTTCANGQFPSQASSSSPYVCQSCPVGTYLQQSANPLFTVLNCTQCPDASPRTDGEGSTSVDDCESNEVCVNPDLNNCPASVSVCQPNDAVQPPYDCVCNAGYRHPADDKINCLFVCDSIGDAYCENGGTCRRDGEVAQCLCRDGFSGDTCAVNDALLLGSESTYAIGFGIGGAFLFILLVVGVVSCVMCLKKQQRMQQPPLPKAIPLSRGASFSTLPPGQGYYTAPASYYLNPTPAITAAPSGTLPIAHFESPDSPYMSRSIQNSARGGASGER